MRVLLNMLSVFMPWGIRRRMLVRLFGFEIHPSARIGLSWVLPAERLVMGPGARIGHLNMIRSLDELDMGEGSLIGTLNWITANLAGFTEPDLDHRIESRVSVLALGRFSSVSTRHYFDVSDTIEIGEFSDVAGLRSVLLTHHLDIKVGLQACQPIRIGSRCFLSTNSVVLGGASLPSNSILGAGAVLIDEQTETFSLYTGCPARQKKKYDPGIGWFDRSSESIADSRRRWSAKPRVRAPRRRP